MGKVLSKDKKKQCEGNKHSKQTFICEEGCDETLCVNCCVISLNKKRCCFSCKITAARKLERKSEVLEESKAMKSSSSPSNVER